MSDINRDFIPADADPGAQGDGFRDFVPARVPQPAKVVETLKEPEAKTPETVNKTPQK